MPRPKQADPLARRQILAAALTVFSRQGYAGTTLDDITAAANLSKGAIYWYFESKADLFATMLGERASIFSQLLEDAVRGVGGAARHVAALDGGAGDRPWLSGVCAAGASARGSSRRAAREPGRAAGGR